jgi:hypothetical protein
LHAASSDKAADTAKNKIRVFIVEKRIIGFIANYFKIFVMQSYLQGGKAKMVDNFKNMVYLADVVSLSMKKSIFAYHENPKIIRPCAERFV